MSNLFLFMDEAGDFSFNRNGSHYLVFTCLSTVMPSSLSHGMSGVRYSLHQRGFPLQRFHAAEDKQAVRDRVFPILSASTDFELDSEIVEKRKTHEILQSERLYSRVYGILLRYVLKRQQLLARFQVDRIDSVHIICDTVPNKRKRKAMEGSLKMEASACLRDWGIQYSVVFHNSAAHHYLQAADYCGWAIFRKWERSDLRSYELIREKIHSEYEVFRAGTVYYY